MFMIFEGLAELAEAAFAGASEATAASAGEAAAGEAASAAGEAAEAGEAAATALETNPVVDEMAEAPAISGEASQSAIQSFIANNPVGQALWKIAQGVATEAVNQSVIFGVMYGLNKAFAQNTQSTGNKTPLSVYLQQVQANFEKLGLTWNSTVEQETAQAAQSFPWIDCSK